MKHTAFSRAELVRQASLTAEDLERACQCRRDFNQLGFGYQVGFVRLLSRFPAKAGVDVGMLEHISPIEWENVILYGQYVIDRRLIRSAKRR